MHVYNEEKQKNKNTRILNVYRQGWRDSLAPS